MIAQMGLHSCGWVLRGCQLVMRPRWWGIGTLLVRIGMLLVRISKLAKAGRLGGMRDGCVRVALDGDSSFLLIASGSITWLQGDISLQSWWKPGADGESWTPRCRALLVFSAGKLLSVCTGHGMQGRAVLPPCPKDRCALWALQCRSWSIHGFPCRASAFLQLWYSDSPLPLIWG